MAIVTGCVKAGDGVVQLQVCERQGDYSYSVYEKQGGYSYRVCERRGWGGTAAGCVKGVCTGYVSTTIILLLTLFIMVFMW